jgi:hypothetical protein
MSDLDRLEREVEMDTINTYAEIIATVQEVCFLKCKNTFYAAELALPDQQCIKNCAKKFSEAMKITHQVQLQRLQKLNREDKPAQ